VHPTFNLHTTKLRLNTKMGWRFKVSPPYSLPSNGIVILGTPTDTVVLTREVRYACNIQKLSSESHWHLATAMPQSTGECPWVIVQLIRIPRQVRGNFISSTEVHGEPRTVFPPNTKQLFFYLPLRSTRVVRDLASWPVRTAPTPSSEVYSKTNLDFCSEEVIYASM